MKQSPSFLCCALTIIAICSAGCATTQQAPESKPAGFLGDYSQLHKGGDGEALLTYRNPRAQFTRYKKIMIDPVAVYTGRQESDLKKSPPEDRQALARYFDASLREELSKHFRIVTSPGLDVLRLRVALTDADQSEVLLDTVTTIMPIGLALSAIKRVSFGADSFVGFAQAEAEVLDSESSIRLAAAVDKRYGTKALRSKFGSWNHAKEAMDSWSKQIAERLVEFGAGHP